MNESLRDLCVVFFVVILPISAILSVTEFFYLLARITDHSQVRVICDNKIIYEGRGYRVSYTNLTENLQSPIFEVVVKFPINTWAIEKSAVCNTFKEEVK